MIEALGLAALWLIVFFLWSISDKMQNIYTKAIETKTSVMRIENELSHIRRDIDRKRW